MPLYIMATTLSPGYSRDPKTLEEVEKQVEEKIEALCPGVDWLGNYATLGPYDYVDIFTAPDTDTALKLALLVRTFGHATTEVWPATDWAHFKSIARALPRAEV